MVGNERDLHPLPEEAFGRYDETPVSRTLWSA
jgi:FKBP-type peptidyl-prolyl cis-trans isomerase 2